MSAERSLNYFNDQPLRHSHFLKTVQFTSIKSKTESTVHKSAMKQIFLTTAPFILRLAVQ